MFSPDIDIPENPENTSKSEGFWFINVAIFYKKRNLRKHFNK